MFIQKHRYKYFSYEQNLAERELRAAVAGGELHPFEHGYELNGNVDVERLHRLIYFSEVHNGSSVSKTRQALLETAATAGKKRQGTRYSVHGLHEYKGKFNPQVAAVLLNIFDIGRGHRVLDPFCGSGTTLVEAAHAGAASLGTDMNPFAVYLANAKLQALQTASSKLWAALEDVKSAVKDASGFESGGSEDLRRIEYLRRWFDVDILQEIERVRHVVTDSAGHLAPIFLCIASNILREYSLQDPNDLRIRRRKSPLPQTRFGDAFIDAACKAIDRITVAQEVLGDQIADGQALCADVAALSPDTHRGLFDAAITSPPYAMALPYIDTQRLSLIWLGLASPSEIAVLEADLIGSREFRGKKRRETIMDGMYANSAELPQRQIDFCCRLQRALAPTDGFRRQSVPSLLYRYFGSMRDSFSRIKSAMRPGAPFALVVGHNHTVLGGTRYDIDTPRHLAELAGSVGWEVAELFQMETYRRYGYHAANAVAAETLVLLRRPLG